MSSSTPGDTYTELTLGVPPTHDLTLVGGDLTSPPSKLHTPVSTDFSGCRISQYANAWLSAPPWIRTTISRGYDWRWISPPSVQFQSYTNTNSTLLRLVNNMLQKGAIYEAPHQRWFQSRIFSVPKSDGSDRLILDLSILNTYISVPTFKMTNHTDLRKILPTNSWMGKLDIKDAYLHVPIRRSLHRYLAFTIDQRLFFFQAFPFGLSPAPLVFTKILKFPLTILREKQINTMAYLDDWILWSPSKETLAANIATTINLLGELGFLINLEKSHTSPTQDIQWSSRKPSVSLTCDFKTKLTLAMETRLRTKSTSRRQWEKIVGMAAFACQVLPQAKLFFHPLAKPQLRHNSSRDLSSRLHPL